ncbi:MAG: class I SAM-dependent methyltransferase [Planctomycetota bacterium]|nr:MAG: class I SAM-dependent methyltransferase [Planctomycetota bacterium]
MRAYPATFYQDLDRTARPSARVVVPLLMRWIRPRAVVDVGCGDGSWLAEFAAAGAEHVHGLDGDWVREDQLKIPRASFQRCALDQSISVARRFDLAVSLEVAEHLPQARAAGLVRDLAQLAPVVLFSAAIPEQGGLNHVNEQWPDWWAELFAREGLQAVDALRWRLWNEADVTWWYKQNMLLYATPAALEQNPELAAARASSPTGVARLVHPHKYAEALRSGRPSLRRWLKMAPAALRDSFGGGR